MPVKIVSEQGDPKPTDAKATPPEPLPAGLEFFEKEGGEGEGKPAEGDPGKPAPAEGDPKPATPAVAKPAEGEEPPPPADGPEGARFAASWDKMLQRDRELQQKAALIQGASADLDSYRELQQLSKDNPGEALRRLGIDPFDAATGYYGGKEEEIAAAPEGSIPPELRQELEESRRFRAAYAENEQAKQQQAAVHQETRTAQATLQGMAEKAPVLATLSKIFPDVVDNMVQHRRIEAEQNRRLVDYEDIVLQQNEHRGKQLVQTFEALLEVPEFRAMLDVKKLQAVVSGGSAKPPGISQPSRTLTPDMATDEPGRSNVRYEELDDDAAEKLAIETLRKGWAEAKANAAEEDDDDEGHY